MGVALINAVVQMTPVELAAIAVRTATFTGTAVNVKAYEGQGKVILHGLRTTGDLAVTIEESADGSTGWTTCTTDVFAGFTAVAAGTTFLQYGNLNLSKVKAFIRVVGTASNTPSHTYGVTLTGPEKYRST